MNSITILSVFALSLGLVFGGDAGACDSFTNCRCQFSDGSVLDLSGVGTKTFTDVNGEWSYQYDPCTSLKLQGKCANAVACKYNLLTNVYDSLGLESEATFSNDQGKVSISYTEGAQTFQVNLECTSGADTLTQTKAEETSYVFSLSGSNVCVQAPNTSTTTTPASTNMTTASTTTPKATNATTTAPTTSTTTPKANTTKTTPTSSTTSKTTKTTPTSGTTSNTTKTTATTGTTSKTTATTGTTKHSTSGKPTTKSSPTTATSKKPTGSTKSTVTPGSTMTTKHGAASAISSLTFGSLVVLAFLSRKLL